MTKSAALNKAIKLWGKNGAVQDRRVKSSPASRQAARDELAAIPKEFPEPYPTDDQTIGELKAWQKRRTAFMQARRDVAAHIGIYRFTVGCVALGMFFEVKGEGDSWEEAFAQAEARAAKRATV